MKKPILLIPTLLTIGSVPLVSLVGCKHVIDPRVTEEEMEKAIKLEGVEYLQTHKIQMSIYGQMTTTTLDQQFSPTVYHQIQIVGSTDTHYSEQYVVKIDDSTYKKYSRSSPDTQTWEEIDVEESAFCKVESIANSNWFTYLNPINRGSSYTYNENLKCYTATVEDAQGSGDWQFYFEDKKLVKFNANTHGSRLGNDEETTFTYNRFTPQPPK